MTTINFQDPKWSPWHGKLLCDDEPDNNTLQDETAGIRFIIFRGKMEIKYGGGLVYQKKNCHNEVLSNSKLVIRFDDPQNYVNINVVAGYGNGPISVLFFKEINETQLASELAFNQQGGINVIYNHLCTPIKEIVITSDRNSNSVGGDQIFTLEFMNRCSSVVSGKWFRVICIVCPFLLWLRQLWLRFWTRKIA